MILTDEKTWSFSNKVKPSIASSMASDRHAWLALCHKLLYLSGRSLVSWMKLVEDMFGEDAMGEQGVFSGWCVRPLYISVAQTSPNWSAAAVYLLWNYLLRKRCWGSPSSAGALGWLICLRSRFSDVSCLRWRRFAQRVLGQVVAPLALQGRSEFAFATV